jgi:hypothetical protein
MAQRESTRIPWASLAVMATFVSGTLIVPKAFDLLRPAEKERAQQFSGADLEVDARLWEDPFAAVRRHEQERVERCRNPAAATRRECDAAQRDARRSPAALRAHLDANRDGEIDAQTTLLVAVLVPGNPFVGAEEARRRTRFALLSGLQAEGYYSDSAEQIGLMQVPLAPIAAMAPLTRLNAPRHVAQAAAAPSSAAGAAVVPDPTEASRRMPVMTAPVPGGDTLQIPYELLSRQRNLRADDGPPDGQRANARRPYESIAVVWVDEAALPGPKLDGVARLLDTVIACRQQLCPRLAILGPSSADGLDLVLHGLEAALLRRSSAPENIDASLANGYRLLAQAHFFSPAATIADADLPLLRRYGQSLDEFFTAYFTGIVPERARLPAAQRAVSFTRTIGTDDTVATLLAGEVLQRLPAHEKRRVVVFVESDSIYARGLERRLRHLLAHGPQIARIEQMYFFRGIDGVTVRDGSGERSAPAARGKGEGKGDAEAVEWPESRDQLDYLRRVAEDLKASESAAGGGPIGAIGLFANDVHDKLLVLQALHDTFPDKMFFTTDMDARFVHPRVLPFTRNLVVASSLPLKMPAVLEGDEDGSAVRAVRAARQVQEGTPPFRDVYQTATYLAARMAACTRQCGTVQRATQAAIASPSVYEVGRNGAVAIGGYDATARRAQNGGGGGKALALAAGLGLLGLALVFLPGTPSLRRARAWARAASSPAAPAGLAPAAPWLAAGYGLWFGFAAASIVETALAGSLGLEGALAWAALGGLVAVLLCPGLAIFAPLGQSARRNALRGLTWALVLLVPFIAGSIVGQPNPGQGEPLGWLDGISGWPSHWLHLLAVLVVLVSLDLFWHRMHQALAADSQWLGLAPPQPAPAATGQRQSPGLLAALQRLLAEVLPRSGAVAQEPGRTGTAGERADSVDFAHLWQRFAADNAPRARLVRVLFWTLLTAGIASALFVLLTGRYLPEVPVRGGEHRALVMTALLAALAALPALVMVVADATYGTCRLLLALGQGRAQYPSEVVQRFASGLGPALAPRLAAPPGAVSPPSALAPASATPSAAASAPAAAHSLLDDWISVQLAARQTQAVAPWIVAPFIALGLMMVARSRLFDSWAMTWPLALTAAVYLLGLVGLAVALKLAAERLREAALARMRADLTWLTGAGAEHEKLLAPLKQLIADVEGNTTGAFAPMLEQPLVASLLVPLGSAGGVQLVDHLLLTR